MARRYLGLGRTLLLVISNPANSTVSAAKTNLSGLRVMPLLPQVSSHSVAWWKLVSIECDHRRVSSIHFTLSGMWATTSSNRRVQLSPEAM